MHGIIFILKGLTVVGLNYHIIIHGSYKHKGLYQYIRTNTNYTVYWYKSNAIILKQAHFYKVDGIQACVKTKLPWILKIRFSDPILIQLCISLGVTSHKCTEWHKAAHSTKVITNDIMIYEAQNKTCTQNLCWETTRNESTLWDMFCWDGKLMELT